MSSGKSQIVKARTMQGVLELLPRQQVAFQRLLQTIRDGFERFGFLPIETPVMELTGILLNKSGGDTEKQVYFGQSTGSREQGKEPDLALRFDLTVPLARYVAEHEAQLVFPFRRYQIQQVYRGERPQRGRYREFYQCDIDVVGKDSLDPRYDAEIPAVIIGIFQRCDFGDFTVHMSNRKLLFGLLESLGVGDDKRAGVLREVDKIDKRGRDYLTETLASDEFSLAPDTIDAILEFIGLSGSSREVLSQIQALPHEAETWQQGLSEVARLLDCLEALRVPEKHYRLNLAIARGLDYYTGTVYETLLDEHPQLGSICSGGLYDNLAGLYTRSHLPGVGMSIGLTRLFYQLTEVGLVGDGVPTAQVLITQLDPDYFRDYLSIASALRESGVRTEVVLEDWKFKKQMKYANQSGVPWVVIMGKDERTRGEVTLKNMASGEQEPVPIGGLADRIMESEERRA